MKIANIVGARPQFIKVSSVSKALKQAGHAEVLIHTGQHYDYEMSRLFFQELALPEPDMNLAVGSGSHGAQTGRMLALTEEALQSANPDCVIVYGDTNSTLAGALAACKLGITVAHVEAGMRSYNRRMPEEYNRIVADHCSDILFCSSAAATRNLAREGINRRVHIVGDTMYDAVLGCRAAMERRVGVLRALGLRPKSYVLATVHRASNVDRLDNLAAILAALNSLDESVIFPVHPRTRQAIESAGLRAGVDENVKLIEPVGFLDMLVLESNARIVVTDSGGVQKEAFYFGVPCVTLREETEWVETVESGWNILAGADPERIRSAVKTSSQPAAKPAGAYGDGHAGGEIVKILEAELGSAAI